MRVSEIACDLRRRIIFSGLQKRLTSGKTRSSGVRGMYALCGECTLCAVTLQRCTGTRPPWVVRASRQDDNLKIFNKNK